MPVLLVSATTRHNFGFYCQLYPKSKSKCQQHFKEEIKGFACQLTLKAVAFTPCVLSLLKLALNVTSLVGSMGSFASLFSARISSSRLGSFEKAPSSISSMRFPVRSILLNVAGCKHTEKDGHVIFTVKQD